MGMRVKLIIKRRDTGGVNPAGKHLGSDKNAGRF